MLTSSQPDSVRPGAEETFQRATDAAWAEIFPGIDIVRDDVETALRAAAAVFDAEQQAYADKLVAETGIAGVDIHDGAARLNLVLAHELAAKMTWAFRTILDAQPGAENYVEQEVVERESGDRYVFAVCKPNGLTPHQLRQRAEQEVERLREKIARLPAEMSESKIEAARRRAISRYEQTMCGGGCCGEIEEAIDGLIEDLRGPGVSADA